MGDLITLTEPESGVNDTFWIESIRHEIIAPAELLTTFGVSEQIGGYAIWGDGYWGTSLWGF